MYNINLYICSLIAGIGMYKLYINDCWSLSKPGVTLPKATIRLSHLGLATAHKIIKAYEWY